MKPGYKTTEFYVTILTIGALILTEVSSANVLPLKYGSIAAAVAAAGYAIARGLTKHGTPGA